MVEYAYPELFAEHDSVHFIIVNSSATVTGVDYSAPEITGNDFLITENEMKQEAFDLTESICSEDNLKFGSNEATHVSFTIYNLPEIPNLADDEISIYIYFNQNSATLFPVCTVVVKEDTYSADRMYREISAYDVLNYLREYNITKWYNSVFKNVSVRTIKYLRDNLFTWLNGKIEGYTILQEEINLVNDDLEIEKSIESDTVTFGFFMSGLLEANGVFGHIGRDKVFRYVSLETYDQPAKATITPEMYFPPLQYQDYHVWGIGFVDIWDRNNIKLAHEGSSAYTYPSIYNIIDNFVFVNNTNRSGWKDEVKNAAQNIRDNITHMWYYPFEVKCIGNLCLEAGDRVDLTRIEYDENDNPVEKIFYSYILERHFHGIQGFKDTISAQGDRKQPRYKPTSRWHQSDSADNSVDGNDGTGEVVDDSATNFIKYCRNIGIRLLQEPSVNLEYVRSGGTHQVEITWSDPSDITNYKPVPCAWAGTIVVRSESKPPVHPWDDCEILVDSTIRDEYSETPFIDNTIEENKKYYYGIFPYHIALDDADHPIKYYRFTKVISVNTQRLTLAPLIVSHSVSGSDVTLTIEIPVLDDGSYSYVKAVAKKGSIPASKTDGTVIDLSATATSVTFSGLDEQSHYYFVIFANDGGASDIASDPDDCTTGRNEGYNFAYTGSIQTFTAPRTGIYQLETWGAQGGNASDDNLVARGGYGAYAKGEVFLTQGETIYINVGGQNGYGGGGGSVPYCLRQIMYDGSLVDLLQIDDFSIIPNSLKNGTSFSDASIESYSTAPENPPVYITELGDVLWKANTETTSENTSYTFIESNYLKISFGKHTTNITYWGLSIYDKVSGTDFRYGFTSAVPSGKERQYRLGVILDHENQRGYLMVYMTGYVGNIGDNTLYFDMYGGKVNNVDYVYETFKNY